MTPRAALSSLLFLVACGGAATNGPVVVEAPKPKPKDAIDLAIAAVGGKVTTTVWIERMRSRPIADKLKQLDLWGPYLAGTSIDPMADLDRCVFSAPAARKPEETIMVAEHHLEPEKVKSAIDVLIGRSDPPGAWISEQPMEAKVTIRGYTRVIAVVSPTVFVMVPEAFVPKIATFANTGGVPDPSGSESLISSVDDPSKTLAGPRVPPIPASLSHVTTKIGFGEDGSSDIAIDGVDASPDQATSDAKQLTDEIDDATTVRVAIVKIRFVEPIIFKPDGSDVKSNIHLAPADVDKLLGFASALRPH